MNVDDLSRHAYSGMKPPDELSDAEWMLYVILAELYERVRNGQATRASGRSQKDEAVKHYEAVLNRLTDYDRLMDWHSKLWKRIEYAATQYSKAEQHTPEADEFYKAVYGVGAGGRKECDTDA